MHVEWFLPLGRESGLSPRATQLFCLPYAGGSAAVYRTWIGRLRPEVEVRAVQLPGRGWRLNEAPVDRMDPLADRVAGAIAGAVAGPFALFGHSMGSWLGLEVVRRLEAMGHRPVCFFASGRQGPSLGCTEPPMAHLPDDAFVDEVQRRYGGIPPEIRHEPELVALLLPSLRADIALLEEYRHAPPGPVRTPIHALHGLGDRVVPRDGLDSWAIETEGGFDLTEFPGGHFYFQPDEGPLLEFLGERLRQGAGDAGNAGTPGSVHPGVVAREGRG